MNDFLPEYTPGFSSESDGTSLFKCGDLVTMTIVDVIETDESGKVLSFCAIFDNRSVRKTYHTTEKIRKQSDKMMERINVVSKSKAVAGANKGIMLVRYFQYYFMLNFDWKILNTHKFTLD